ncbi:MAG: M1 family metallopeptidase, partial [Planctomycetota bacterium]
KSNEEASITDTIYKSENGRWVEHRKVEYDSAREYDLIHVDIEADVDPTTAGVEAKARASVKILSEAIHKIYLRVAWELQVKQVDVDGVRALFSRYGDLIEIPLSAAAKRGQTVKVDIDYAGTLRLPSGRHRLERRGRNTLFVSSRWYPFIKSWYHEGMAEACTFEADITVPQDWYVGAAEIVGTKAAGRTWRYGSDTPCDRIGLVVTRLNRQQAKYGDITVTVFARSIGDKYMRQIAERACDTLRYYETAFGKYPHRNLAIVEYEHMSAGGIAVPSIVLMNTERCRPEHTSDMLNMYVPHEVAHQWHSSALPIWIAEASAVYSNYLYLAQGSDGQGYLADFHEGLNNFLEANKDYPVPLVNSSDTIAYVRGGYLLMMLTSANKQRTVDSLRAFITDQLPRQLADKDATVERFIEAMNKAGGAYLTEFVSDWVYTVDKFDPAVTGFVQSKTAANKYGVKASLANYEKIRFPVPLRISFEDGTSHDVTWNNTEENETIEWTFERAVRSITLDPDNVLLDWNRHNNFRRVSAFVAGEATKAKPAPPAKKQTANWTTYTVADGLAGNSVSCLTIDSKGALYAGISQYSRKPGTVVNRFDGQWTQPDSLSEASGPVYAVTVGDDGTIWTGVSSNRLRRIDKSGTTIFTLSQFRQHFSFSIGKAVFGPHPQANTNIPGAVVHDLMTDNNGNILMATDSGVSIIDEAGALLNHFDTEEGLPGSEVLSITHDA